MAAGLTVRADLVMRRLNLIVEDLPPEQLAKWGWPLKDQGKPLMLKSAAIRLLGEAAVDKALPELGEHRAYFKGRELANPHYELFSGLIDGPSAERHYKGTVKLMGKIILEGVLRNNGD